MTLASTDFKLRVTFASHLSPRDRGSSRVLLTIAMHFTMKNLDDGSLDRARRVSQLDQEARTAQRIPDQPMLNRLLDVFVPSLYDCKRTRRRVPVRLLGALVDTRC
jgi:hypothetical protein